MRTQQKKTIKMTTDSRTRNEIPNTRKTHSVSPSKVLPVVRINDANPMVRTPRKRLRPRDPELRNVVKIYTFIHLNDDELVPTSRSVS